MAHAISASRGVERRRWADVTVIVMGLWAIAEAAWGASVMSQVPQDRGAGYAQFAFLVGGMLSILGIFIAQKREKPGRALILLAGVLHLGIPVAYQHHAWAPIGAGALIGIALIAASFFAGVMPADNHFP